MPQFAIITGFLGQTKDRFHTYNQEKTLEEKLSIVADTPGYVNIFPEATKSNRRIQGIAAGKDGDFFA